MFIFLDRAKDSRALGKITFILTSTSNVAVFKYNSNVAVRFRL
jgi:hypothetical protein